MAYDPQEYWKDKPLDIYPAHKDQEVQLLKVLKELNFNSVLEVGCGTGRISKLIRDNFQIDEYKGIDLSEYRIKEAKNAVNNDPRYSFQVAPFQFMDVQKKYDLVIAIEVLMHVPPKEFPFVYGKMLGLAEYDVVSLDYSPGKGMEEPLEPHNFLHDYPSIIQNLPHRVIKISDKQMIFHVIIDQH